MRNKKSKLVISNPIREITEKGKREGKVTVMSRKKLEKFEHNLYEKMLVFEQEYAQKEAIAWEEARKTCINT